MITRFTKYVKEELDAVTVGMVGNGTAVTGYPTGSWTTSAGVSVYGGDSDTAFAGNASNTKSMEQEVIVPPKTIFKEPRKKRNKKDKKERPYNRIGNDIDQLDRPTMKVNESVEKDTLVIMCQFNTLEEAYTVINTVGNISPNIEFNYNKTIDTLTTLPNWLSITMNYNWTKIRINFWGHDPFNDDLTRITDIIQEHGYVHHLYTVSELPSIVSKIKTYFDMPSAPDYSPKKIVRTLEGKVNENSTKKPAYTICCQVENRTEAVAIVNMVKRELSQIKLFYYTRVENIRQYPNWLYLDMDYNKSEIEIFVWGDYISYENALRSVTNDIRTTTTADKQLYTFGELSTVLSKMKQYFNVAPNYLPKRTTRTLENMVNEEFYYSQTVVCKFDTLQEAHTIIDRITRISHDLTVNYNESMDESLHVFPNWLFMELTPNKNDIYINYWGNNYGRHEVETQIRSSLTRDDYDHHMYTYSELENLVTKIKGYFGIPVRPDYSPKGTKRTLENNNDNMKTFDQFNESTRSEYMNICVTNDKLVKKAERLLGKKRQGESIKTMINKLRKRQDEADDKHKAKYDDAISDLEKFIDNCKDVSKLSKEWNRKNESVDKLYEDEGSGGVASATLGNTGGMGAIVSAQPSSIPGDVAGSTIGSGDISRGTPLGPYTKIPQRKPNKRKKKDKSARKYNQLGSSIDNFYVTKYAQSNNNGKFIQSWQTFTDTK